MILNDQEKTIHLFELTCPSENNIEQRHTEKSNKYAHFTSDINDYKCKVNAFEVSSKGYLTTRNHTTLATLHKFINPTMKLSHFSKRTSLLSHWQHLTTSSTADLTLLLWNHHSSCPKSRPDLCIIFIKVAMWEPRHVQGQYTLCLNPLSCCPRPMAPLSISI